MPLFSTISLHKKPIIQSQLALTVCVNSTQPCQCNHGAWFVQKVPWHSKNSSVPRILHFICKVKCCSQTLRFFVLVISLHCAVHKFYHFYLYAHSPSFSEFRFTIQICICKRFKKFER